MEWRTRINDHWFFRKAPLGTDLAEAARAEGWQPVDIPHDWLIADPKNLYETGEGWYRRTLKLNVQPGESCLLRFEGVYMDCAVFLNGHLAGEWKYGYSTFDVDVTALVRPGENELMVRCVFQAPNSRWYSGAGIYRSVYLCLLPPVHFEMDGIYITPVPAGDAWRVEIDAEIGRNAPLAARLSHAILDPDGREMAVCEGLVPHGASEDSQEMLLSAPQLWDVEAPFLYTLRSTLSFPGGSQTVTQRFGLRTLGFDSQQGFSLNGRGMKLHGVCCHHDLGALGAAVNKAALRRQLAVLQGAGVNAIRTAHNMPAVELMDLCDEMGLLVLTESFDMWEQHKTAHDYAAFFPDWSRRDVRSWVRRDRNHPCLLMWSIGNEIYDTHAGPRGQEITRQLMAWVRESDPKHHAPCTLGSNYMPWENAQRCADMVKIAGYNYAERYYAPHHSAHPDWVIYGSETCSVVQSRGVYHFPAHADILADDDLQCSALGNSRTSWGAKSYEQCIIADRDAPFSLGQFLWSGFDYIGEPTPYHTKNSYFGLVDTAGFPKDAYYVFQSAWTDGKRSPFVHIFPYWDFNPGQMIDVLVCSNAPRVQLFLNGRPLGVQKIDHERGLSLIARWHLPYEPGVLRAEAYDEGGAIVARAERRSFGNAKKIRLSCDRAFVLADGQDMAFVEISMEDEAGNPVENANNRVRVKVTGAGRLAGLDNGDSTDWDSYQGDSRRLFSGKLLAMIAAVKTPGTIEIAVESSGLPAAHLLLEAHPSMAEPGVSCARGCTESPFNPEIPIRKIEIDCPDGRALLPECPQIRAHACLLPENASYDDISWRVTTAEGIDTALASLTFSGRDAVVRARGDGLFYLRCMANNGADHPRVLAQIECTVTGMGPALLNPYGFVSGGLYAFSRGDVGTGNERGFATARDGETMVGFSNLDFGIVGSDEITLPIFALDSEKHILEIWLGSPDAGGEKLLDAEYQKPSRWNVYQEETYRLPRRLTGVCAVSFVAREKMHIKGFSFKRYERAWERLSAAARDSIYGDCFQIDQDAVIGIGNNVSLVFSNMNFGPNEGVTLTLCGRTPLPKNTVQVRFLTDGGEQTCLAEFTHASAWESQVFRFPPVPESCTVMFIFLPGCQFDFQWFQFSR